MKQKCYYQRPNIFQHCKTILKKKLYTKKQYILIIYFKYIYKLVINITYFLEIEK